MYKHLNGNIVNEPYFCPDCKLYWSLIDEHTLEFRPFMFIPVHKGNIKKCRFCNDPTLEIPEQLKKYRG